MKNHFKLLFVFLLIVLVTGCSKSLSENINNDNTVTFKNDKSMEIDMIYSVEDNNRNRKLYDFSSESEAFRKAGYSVTGYKEGNRYGIEVVKRIKNIDKVTSSDNLGMTITIKKNLFKNHYKVNIKKEDLTNITGKTLNMNITYNVNLDEDPITSNATGYDNDGKTLNWDLSSFTDDLYFEFSLYNTLNIMLIGGAGLVVFILVIVYIINGGRSNHTNAANEINVNKFERSYVVTTEEPSPFEKAQMKSDDEPVFNTESDDNVFVDDNPDQLNDLYK